MKYFIKTFFQNKINLWILILATLTIVSIMGYYAAIDEFRIYPNQDELDYSFFNDSANGGSSEIDNGIINDSIIEFNFHLKKGFLTPYVGLNIKPTTNAFLNLNPSNQIILDIYTEGVENIGLYINTFYEGPENEQADNELKSFHSFKVLTGRDTYTIHLDKLKVPDWYLEVNNFNEKSRLKPNLAKLTYINLATAYPTTADDIGKIKVYSISFDRSNKNLTLILSAIILSILALLLIVHALKLKLSNKSETVTIAYKPIEINESKQESKTFLSYINTNFNNAELTLELVSKQTGVRQRNIANEIQDTYGYNFKTYLNQIRINESKRLLKETDLNIGEIAFKVGFNNQSHFNRVFKNLINISPTTYRDQNNR